MFQRELTVSNGLVHELMLGLTDLALRGSLNRDFVYLCAEVNCQMLFFSWKGVVWRDPHCFVSGGKDGYLYQHIFKDAKRPADSVVRIHLRELPWCPVLLLWCPLQGSNTNLHFPHRSVPSGAKFMVWFEGSNEIVKCSVGIMFD